MMFKILFLVIVFTVFCAIMVVVLPLALIAWLCGAPLTITRGGRKEVYRWTKRIK